MSFSACRVSLLLTCLLILEGVALRAQNAEPNVKEGDRVELVVIEKSQIYDPATNGVKEVERDLRVTGTLRGITERAYHVMVKEIDAERMKTFPRIRVKSIRSVEPEDIAPVPSPTAPPKARAAAPTPAANAVDTAAAGPVLALIGARRYEEAASKAVELLRNASTGDAPGLAAALSRAIDGWLGDIEYDTTRIVSPDSCGRIEGQLNRIVQFFYRDAVKRLPANLLARTKYLSRLMSVWGESYIRRVGFMRGESPEQNETREERVAEQKQQLRTMAKNLDKSIYYSENLPPNARVLWAQAEIQAYLGDKAKAQELAGAAAQAAISPESGDKQTNRALAAQIRDFRDRIGQMATVEDLGKPKVAKATPRRPTPARTSATNDDDAKKTVALPPANGKWGQVKRQAQYYWNQYGKPYAQIALDHPKASGGIAAFIVIFWIVPVVLMRAHVSGGDVRASVYRKRVRYLGLAGYIAYRASALRGAKGGAPRSGKPGFFARLFKKKGGGDEDTAGHLTCSACSKPIDRVEDYALSLKFDACPHCGVAIDPVIEFEEFVAHLIERATAQAEKTRSMKNDRKRMKAEEIEAQTMARMLNGMYALAVRRRATDIHLQRDAKSGQITYRVDGMLNKPVSVPSITAPALLSAVKIQAGLDITNHTTPQDGRINLNIEGVNFDIRVNCAPTPEGEVIFLRLLDKRNILISARQLGFTGKDLESFEEAIARPHGLILVTGPTGSGKSTTLYVAMNAINTGERNILTIEDPVEYQIEGLKQMQVNPAKDFTFATGLRSILRQDPDVIMVGEIRDHETANMAVEASITGHLVFTTLHTMDTASAVSRLNDLGVNSDRYASALTLTIAQRLFRLICEECKQPHIPTDAQLQKVGLLNYRDKIKFQAGAGCPMCNYTGYYGRRAVLEMFSPNDQLRRLMEKEFRPHVLRDAARQHGMRLLRESAALKVVSGETSIEEIIRVTT